MRGAARKVLMLASSSQFARYLFCVSLLSSCIGVSSLAGEREVRNVGAGRPIVSDSHAGMVCQDVARRYAEQSPDMDIRWTGNWTGSEYGRESTCELEFSWKHDRRGDKYGRSAILNLGAGRHIISDTHARSVCPDVAKRYAEEHPDMDARWTGRWSADNNFPREYFCEVEVTRKYDRRHDRGGRRDDGRGGHRTFNLGAGPIWNNNHARQVCPRVIADYASANPGRNVRWTGQWETTVPGRESVCQAEEW